MSRLYADHNASSPLRPQARAAMMAAMESAANPSAVHHEGRAAKRILEDSRERLAGVLECLPDAITFTCGATEALHIAMDSAKAMGLDGPVFVNAVEHDAVWVYAQRLWPDAQIVPVNSDCVIDVDWLSDRLNRIAGRPLLIAQGANNETGTLQPLDCLSTMVRGLGGAILCDGVQMLGKVSVRDFAGSADWFVVSSHKIGGPAGAGALVTSPGTPVLNTRPGGGQERGVRAGTENVVAASGFAAAASIACTDEAVAQFRKLTKTERDVFEQAITRAMSDLLIVSAHAPRLTNTSCVALPTWEAARQVMALDLAGAAISAGAACSSGKVKSSRVLSAAGYGADIAGCAIRASFGWSTQLSDGQALAQIYLKAGARYAQPQAA
jgi:cysteine desulfurase